MSGQKKKKNQIKKMFKFVMTVVLFALGDVSPVHLIGFAVGHGRAVCSSPSLLDMFLSLELSRAI